MESKCDPGVVGRDTGARSRAPAPTRGSRVGRSHRKARADERGSRVRPQSVQWLGDVRRWPLSSGSKRAAHARDTTPPVTVLLEGIQNWPDSRVTCVALKQLAV